MTPEQCQRLKQGRLNARYTQQEAADALAVSLRTYEKWEQGGTNPANVETYTRIATLFNISLDWWLLGVTQYSYSDRQILNGIHHLAPDDREAIKRVIRAMNR